MFPFTSFHPEKLITSVRNKKLTSRKQSCVRLWTRCWGNPAPKSGNNTRAQHALFTFNAMILSFLIISLRSVQESKILIAFVHVTVLHAGDVQGG